MKDTLFLTGTHGADGISDATMRESVSVNGTLSGDPLSRLPGATIWQMAKENGWVPEYGHELEWDDTIERDDHVVIDKNWIEDQEVREPPPGIQRRS